VIIKLNQHSNSTRLVKTEFHCHTIYSKDSLVTLTDLLSTCKKKGIQRLVVTDHNAIVGAFLARELDASVFVVGEEIMTQQGELLAFFVQELIPAGLPAAEAIARLHDQNAFISVSHPFDLTRAGRWQEDDLLAITPNIDAIEIYNSRCLSPKSNILAADFSYRHHLLGTVGSDSHSLREVGTATLTLPNFHDAASLKSALRLAEPHVHPSGPWVHFYSSYARWRKQKQSNPKTK
jgi:predicted metal-dependent phosphoesterase TrpH